MKAYHLIQDFRVDSLGKHVGFEFAFVGLHTEREAVARSNILSVVHATTRSIAFEANRSE